MVESGDVLIPLREVRVWLPAGYDERDGRWMGNTGRCRRGSPRRWRGFRCGRRFFARVLDESEFHESADEREKAGGHGDEHNEKAWAKRLPVALRFLLPTEKNRPQPSAARQTARRAERSGQIEED